MLSDRSIKELANTTGFIADFDPKRVASSSYNMRVGTMFHNGEIKNRDGDWVDIPPGGTFTGFTQEELNLPNDIGALAFARNADASLGFMILNPGHIDPGYKGPLTIKAVNLSGKPMPVRRGDPIFRCVFWRLDGMCEEPFGRNPRRRQDHEAEFNRTHVDRQLTRIADLVDQKAMESVANGLIREKAETAIKGTLRGYWLLALVLLFWPVVATGAIAAYAPEVGPWIREQIVLLSGALSFTAIVAWLLDRIMQRRK